MHETIQAHFAKLEKAIKKTGIPDDRKARIAISVEKLPTLYTQYRETNASRYGDEITRLVQGVLKDLEACPEAQKLDGEFRETLKILHEELGVPALALKAPPAPPKPRKTRKK